MSTLAAERPATHVQTETKAPHDDAIISVRGVKKSFGDVHALTGVDLDVQRGTVLGLLGPNGAGKTTLVRIMTTLMKPDAGTVTIAGYDAVRDSMRLRSVIGLAGQYAAVDENLTGRENLQMFGRLYRLDRAKARERADALLERFELADAGDRAVRTYSGGMRRRLDLAGSLIVQPPVLFLDEPTTGLDPRSRIELWKVIRELVADGTTLLLTTQYLDEADQLANTIAVIDRGQIIARGTADELKAQSGGDVLQVEIHDHDRVDEAGQLLAALGSKAPQRERLSGQISMPVAGGTSVLVEAIRRLDNADIEIANIELRRPTLDDVFLALTGESSGSAE